MSELTCEDIEKKVLDYLGKAGQVKARAVFKALGIDKKACDQAVDKLACAGRIEYLYLDTAYIKLTE